MKKEKYIIKINKKNIFLFFFYCFFKILNLNFKSNKIKFNKKKQKKKNQKKSIL